MAEFVMVMSQFARLCDRYTINGCIGCPVDEEGFNCATEKQGYSKSNAEELEAIIMSWAAEHPEPVYPTWAEWLTSIGVYPKGWEIYQTPLKTAIPADIAQKLGIELKEV